MLWIRALELGEKVLKRLEKENWILRKKKKKRGQSQREFLVFLVQQTHNAVFHKNFNQLSKETKVYWFKRTR